MENLSARQISEYDLSGPVTRPEAIAYLTDDGGSAQLRAPCSRYGATAGEIAGVVWIAALVLRDETGDAITFQRLDELMGLAVNDSDDIAYLLGLTVQATDAADADRYADLDGMPDYSGPLTVRADDPELAALLAEEEAIEARTRDDDRCGVCDATLLPGLMYRGQVYCRNGEREDHQ